MNKPPKKSKTRSLTERAAGEAPLQTDFGVVLDLIEAARKRAVAAVNTTLIDLYWSVGEYINRKIIQEGWGQGTVEALANTIHRRYPGMTGYSARNLWRMSQFFETYRDQPKLSPLVRQLSWTHNLLIMSRCKRDEERDFYLRLCLRERWGKRQLERQLAGALFERTVLSPLKLSPVVAELHPEAETAFKDSYLVEFLDLPSGHSESDLEGGANRKTQPVLDGTGPRLLLRRQPVPASGRRTGLRARLAPLQSGAELSGCL